MLKFDEIGPMLIDKESESSELESKTKKISFDLLIFDSRLRVLLLASGNPLAICHKISSKRKLKEKKFSGQVKIKALNKFLRKIKGGYLPNRFKPDLK